MKRICAWCKKDMREINPLDNPATTHGICWDCYTAEQIKMSIYLLESAEQKLREETPAILPELKDVTPYGVALALIEDATNNLMRLTEATFGKEHNAWERPFIACSECGQPCGTIHDLEVSDCCNAELVKGKRRRGIEGD